MAGGTAGDIRTPWPKGSDAWYPLYFGPFNVAANESGKRTQLTIPFAFYPRFCEVSSQVVGGLVNINIQDDTGTPVDIVAAVNLTTGANQRETLTIADKGQKFNAGAIIDITIVSVTGETATDLGFVLWVKPAF